MMKASQAGIDLICKFEGFSAHSYICPAGKLTIGYGHVIHGEHIDEPLTEREALDLLLADLPTYEAAVLSLVEVELNQNRFDALVSWTYNLGTAALAGSTLLRALNNGHYITAANEFLKWDKANTPNGRMSLPGLQRRRAAERDLFLL